MRYLIWIISAGRPDAVAKLAPHLDGLDHTWLVPHADVHRYLDAGAEVVVPDPGSLVGARNAALDATFNRGELACVQLSDDLKKINNLEDGAAFVPLDKNEGTLAWALAEMDEALEETGLALCGCSPTDNLYFAKPGISTRKFIVGDLIMVRPTELRFDPNLRLKEDYDFTLQHWATYGGAARCDYIAPSFSHYTNAGGAVAARTAELEQATIAYLKDKWPGLIRDNPRRPNEILLTTPRRHR
jgi:hypothetical protein